MYTVVFNDNILGLGGPEEFNIELRESFASLEALNECLSQFEDWELEVYSLRVERSDYQTFREPGLTDAEFDALSLQLNQVS